MNFLRHVTSDHQTEAVIMPAHIEISCSSKGEGKANDLGKTMLCDHEEYQQPKTSGRGTSEYSQVGSCGEGPVPQGDAAQDTSTSSSRLNQAIPQEQ